MLLFGSIYIQIYITESNCLPMMFNCASLIGKMWQFFFPEPEVFLSISRCTQSLVFSRWIPLPCIEVSAIEQRSISTSNQRILGGPFCLQLLWAEFWATFPANAPEKTIHCDANYGDVTMEKKTNECPWVTGTEGSPWCWACSPCSFQRSPPLLVWCGQRWTTCSWCTFWLQCWTASCCGWSHTPSECWSACRPALKHPSCLQPAKPA